jgi:hypothetical protein
MYGNHDVASKSANRTFWLPSLAEEARAVAELAPGWCELPLRNDDFGLRFRPPTCRTAALPLLIAGGELEGAKSPIKMIEVGLVQSPENISSTE